MDNVQRALVAVAIEALTHFAGDIDQKQATVLLSMWKHRETLTGEGRFAVYAAFRRSIPE